MTQFKTDVYINGNFYDTFYPVGMDEDDAESQVREDLIIEFETEEV